MRLLTCVLSNLPHAFITRHTHPNRELITEQMPQNVTFFGLQNERSLILRAAFLAAHNNCTAHDPYVTLATFLLRELLE